MHLAGSQRTAGGDLRVSSLLSTCAVPTTPHSSQRHLYRRSCIWNRGRKHPDRSRSRKRLFSKGDSKGWKMLDKATLLLFLHLVTCSISSPLYPALRYSPGLVAGNFQLQHSSPLQSHNPSAEEQEEGLLTDPTEKRTQRHADAIFTDNYRKFLGQISARKFLQTIIGKRLGSSESSAGERVHDLLTRRQSDSVLMDSRYHQHMVLLDFLGAILQNQRPQDISSSELEGFPSTLAKLM